MTSSPWRQTTISFPDSRAAERAAATHLAPILAEAEARGLVNTWFYVRKESWRLRYMPTTSADPYLPDQLARLVDERHITAAISGIYEPEIYAFGGTAAMDVTHQLWHCDSRHLLTPAADGTPDRHHELSIMLCSAMMRAAGLDRYEQGDVWARVADHRDTPDPALVDKLLPSVRRLITVDPGSLTHQAAPLAADHAWFEAYITTGETLRLLNQTGQLRRGLRAILAHHVIFAWNRRSIPGLHQAAVAAAAKNIVFGPDPNTPDGAS